MTVVFDPKTKIRQATRICMNTQKKQFVASGGKFLPNTSRSYLLKAYKKTDKRKRNRLLAYMQRKDGLGTEQIAKSLDRANFHHIPVAQPRTGGGNIHKARARRQGTQAQAERVADEPALRGSQVGHRELRL